MHIQQDYFLLYHGIELTQDAEAYVLKSDDEYLYEVMALLLSCTHKNFTRYTQLDNFHQLISTICTVELKTMEQLYSLQFACIKFLLNVHNSEGLAVVHQSFDYLHQEGLLSKDEHKKLLRLFEPSLFHSPVNDEESGDEIEDFLQQKSALNNEISLLKAVGLDETFPQNLDAIADYLESRSFSIGITGVMNAGKSSLLNTLMGQEILGSSVVPETANLSVIKYAKEPYAKVFYWSKSQWQKIVESAEEMEAMQEFVDQTQEQFGSELDEYIKETPYAEHVAIENLAHYTSANQEKKRCNLIKEVELGVDLEFLSEGIQIVDTPGLDDVVVQREEITLEYLSQCDVMIHLMNVAQSATQKDIAFIIDALLYQKVSHLVIVLTRIDMVSESALEEVKAYTKRSIHEQRCLFRLYSLGPAFYSREFKNGNVF
jgi:GTP-binding protein EngB required for normal cell division